MTREPGDLPAYREFHEEKSQTFPVREATPDQSG